MLGSPGKKVTNLGSSAVRCGKGGDGKMADSTAEAGKLVEKSKDPRREEKLNG